MGKHKRSLFVLAALATLFAGCFKVGDKKALGDKSERKLTKPVKDLFEGKWKPEPNLDEKRYRKMMEENRTPSGTVDKLMKGYHKQIDSTVMEFDANGRYQKSYVAYGLKEMGPVTERGTWKILEFEGRRATVQIIENLPQGKPRTTEMKISFRNDDCFQVDDDPRLRDAIYKKVHTWPMIFHRNK